MSKRNKQTNHSTSSAPIHSFVLSAIEMDSDSVMSVIMRLMKKGLIINVRENCVITEFMSDDEDYTIEPTPYQYTVSDVVSFRMVDGRLFQRRYGLWPSPPVDTDGFEFEPINTFDLAWLITTSHADELKIDVGSAIIMDDKSVNVWSSKTGFCSDWKKLIVPQGLKEDTINGLVLQVHSNLAPLKLLSAINVREAYGIDTLRQCRHMDYETEKNVFKPVVWWEGVA